MKKHVTSIVIGLLIVLMLVLYLVTFTVRTQEKALVLTFGKIEREVTEAGLHWIWPWQQVVTFDGRIHTLESAATQTATSDRQSIIVTAYINWRIVDARAFYEKFRRGKGSGGDEVVRYAEESLGGLISNAINVFAEYRFSELVTLERERFKLFEVGRGGRGAEGPGGMFERIRRDAGSADFGVEIVDVGITQLGVPDSVTEEIFNRVIGERQAEVRRLAAEGQGRAASIIGQAEGEATRIKAEAEAEARKFEGEGDAAAAAHYAKFLEHPSLADFLRKLDTLRKTLSEQTTIVIDADSPAFEMMIAGPHVGGDADRQWLEGAKDSAAENVDERK